MWLRVAALVAFTFLLYSTNLLRAWKTNYATARATGLPCILIPALPHAVFVKLLAPLLFPLLKKLPHSWTDAWLPHLESNSLWHDGYAVFRQVNSDTYFLVAPGGNVLVTCSPDAISQITHRREDFPRPVEMFRAIGVWGPNMATSEGMEWKRHRKIVSRAFGDQNNREVWSETIYQGPRMLQRWAAVAEDSRDSERVPFMGDLMRMSMHIISKAGFGHRMSWDDTEHAAKNRANEGSVDDNGPDEKGADKNGSGEKKFGLSYTEAGRGLVHNILLVIGLPEPLLRFSPIAHLRKVRRYNLAFRAFMSETIERGRKQGKTDGSANDILHSLLRASDDGAPENDQPGLSDQEILANSFVFMLAGHETTATTMQLSLVYLAIHAEAQKQVQQDIDRILGDRKPDSWSYDDDLPQLLDGMVGAVMMEELRLASPVPAVAKLTAGPLPMTIDDLQTSIPGGTIVVLNALAAHRNPKYWPHGPPADPNDPWHAKSNLDNDLEEFKPERWFNASRGNKQSATSSPGHETLFRPAKGAYFPFSEGPRSCLGRRFAQIEYAVVLAVIFQRYSVELDTRAWASDEEVAKMTKIERSRVRAKATKRARETIVADMRLFITMLLKQGTEFPIRLVPRGKELFSESP